MLTYNYVHHILGTVDQDHHESLFVVTQGLHVSVAMTGKSKSGFNDFSQIQWIWIRIGFELIRWGGFGECLSTANLGFGLKNLTGFGFEDPWICPPLICSPVHFYDPKKYHNFANSRQH